jgi:hypothetical protein
MADTDITNRAPLTVKEAKAHAVVNVANPSVLMPVPTTSVLALEQAAMRDLGVAVTSEKAAVPVHVGLPQAPSPKVMRSVTVPGILRVPMPRMFGAPARTINDFPVVFTNFTPPWAGEILPASGMRTQGPAYEQQVFFDVVKGPDGEPMPGQKDESGKPIPGSSEIDDDRGKRGTEVPPHGKLGELLEDDLKKNPNKKGGVLDWPPPPAGKNSEYTWTKVGDGVYWMLRTKVIGKLPEQFGVAYVFYAEKAGCRDLVWIQYIKETFTFYDANGKNIGESTVIGPGLDRNNPIAIHQSQGPDGDSAIMEDQPGITLDPKKSLADNAEDYMWKYYGRYGPKWLALGGVPQLPLPFLPASLLYKAEFWTYLVCLNPWSVYGHFEWSYKLSFDPKAEPPIKVHDVKEPAWKEGE